MYTQLSIDAADAAIAVAAAAAESAFTVPAWPLCRANSKHLLRHHYNKRGK